MNVVVTGLGVAGDGLETPAHLWDLAVSSGRAAARTAGPGRAVFDPTPLLGRGLRYKDRATKLAMLAADRALDAAGILGSEPAQPGPSGPGGDTGVVVSSNFGNLETVCRASQTIARETVSRTSPMDLPNASSNVIASSIAIRHGLRGPNVMLCNGSASGLDAVRIASSLVQSARARRVLVVGVEAVGAQTAEFLGLPAEELFDGAAALVLEDADAAEARGAVPLAEPGGYARRADAGSSAAALLRSRTGWPAYWLTGAPASDASCGHDDPYGLDWPADGAPPRRDVEAVFGAASGALGVLQATAAVHWIGSGGDGTVLATAGGGLDAAASMVFAAPGRAREGAAA